MKLQQLIEMTQSQAVDIFAKHGERLVAASADEVKKARNRLVRQYQSDLTTGGDSVLKQINAAYDVLKHGVQAHPAGHRPYYQDFSQDAASKRGEPQGTPPWAWAGHSGGMAPNATIRREDFTDMNFILKTMWELSGKSNEEWTMHGFDGHFFRGILTVYGNDKIFDKMAEAMHTWQTRGGNSYPCRAVFVTKKSIPGKMLLIYADGKKYGDNPIPMEHESFNANPSNDQSFVRSLPSKLDALRGDAQ
jgi:hypothetical protein